MKKNEARRPASIPGRMLGRLKRETRRRTAAVSDTERLLSAATDADRRIIERSLPFTMTGVARLQALIDAVRYSSSGTWRAPSPSAASGAAARCWR